MRIPRIFTPADLKPFHTVRLDGKAHRHLKDVLRMTAGNKVILFNGNGHDYQGVINTLSKKLALVEIIDGAKVNNESALAIHLLQPVCRSEKMHWCLQKATELGVSKITPFVSARVNINMNAQRLEKKMQHWQAVIAGASEQCGRATLPVIEAPLKFNEAVSATAAHRVKVIASPTNTPDAIKDTPSATKQCICAIGPEGGFTHDELTCAQTAGFLTIAIGPRILRLETAVISALTLCQFRWGDFG